MSDRVPPIAISSATTLANKTGSWKYIRPVYRDRVAPCNAGCPAGVDIEAYMNLLRQDRVDEAVELLLRENPLPATTGRVCDHPCERACNRRAFDDPVSIHAVERMLGDRAIETPPAVLVSGARQERVAVVGSGPAGLSCAWHLARLGYRVTIYEAAEQPGGMLRLGIPEYRLPRRVLDREIDRIRAAGVEIRCRARVGAEVGWRELESFDAVFLGPGAHVSRPLGVQGERAAGILSGLAFLREVNGGSRPSLGERVVVVGGGNTAIDCARTAARLGARPVILYRRTRAEMPAIAAEVAEAEQEGVEFQFLAAPVAVRVEEGRLVGLECERMKLGEPDASGRARPVSVPGSRFFMPADTAITAIGEAADLEHLPSGLQRAGGAVRLDLFGGAGRARFFAGGDLTDQPRTVSWAIGSGKRAAIGIDRFLRAAAGETVGPDDPAALRLSPDGGFSMTRWRGDDPIRRNGPVNEVVTYQQLNVAHFVHLRRHEDRFRHPGAAGAAAAFDEVNLSLEREAALLEARRCFNCGVCNRCENCLIFCPDVAVKRRADGSGFDIAYEYCKGCGICNAECPRGAMAMTREGL